MRWEDICKQARECKTKTAWEALFAENRPQIRSGASPKLLEDIFKYLRSDPQCEQYDPQIWRDLLDGCLASWNLELGRKIAESWQSSVPTLVTIPAAKIYLESGFAKSARELSQRAMRRSQLQPSECLQLEMIICSSYIEENKRTYAIRLLRRLEAFASQHAIPEKEHADFLIYLGRTMFLLGRYQDSIQPFTEAAEKYTQLGDWENASKGFFNAAASIDNAGGKQQAEGMGFTLVEKCRSLAEKHNLRGTLAHCESFYGHNDYWRGNFASARDHYRRALKNLPKSDQSYRRLHLMSMLAFTYLRTGRFQLAKQYGEKTLRIAAQEQSDRFHVRFENLEAELLWQSGEVERSQELLEKNCAELVNTGANTLEELATVSRYNLQCAILGSQPNINITKVSDGLRRNNAEWTQYQLSKGYIAIASNHIPEARKFFEECKAQSQQFGDKYHLGLANLGLLQCSLAGDDHLDSIESNFSELQIAAAQMPDSTLKAKIQIIHAALCYRRGDFDQCRRYLERASKQTSLCFEDQFLIHSWLATTHGKACRITSAWQSSLLATGTRIYFKPSIENLGNGQFVISKHYRVDLTRMPALSELLSFLMNRPHYSAKPEDIQNTVWNQSTRLQGWRQKIRNTIMRIRDCTPYTIAPIIIHTDLVQLFASAIKIEKPSQLSETAKESILRLLAEGPMSSVQLSNRIAVSPATTKRLIKKMQSEGSITVMKLGRQVLYQASQLHSQN